MSKHFKKFISVSSRTQSFFPNRLAVIPFELSVLGVYDAQTIHGIAGEQQRLF